MFHKPNCLLYLNGLSFVLFSFHSNFIGVLSGPSLLSFFSVPRLSSLMKVGIHFIYTHANCKMQFQMFFVTFVMTQFVVTVTHASESVTVLQGKPLELSCKSSFPPPWNWYSSKEGTMKSLSTSGTNPHPMLNEPRYSFQKSKDEYFLRISEVHFFDAGKFICDADSRLTFVLNVLR